MTRIFIACICIFCLFQWSCKNKIGGNDPILNELDKESLLICNKLNNLRSKKEFLESEDNFNKLINKYLEMIQSAPKGSDLSELFIKASNICSKMDKPDQEIVFINNLVKNNPNHPNIKEYIFKMIQLLFKTERQTTAEIMALCYVKAYPNDPKIAELSSKLPKINNPEEYIFEIGKRHKDFHLFLKLESPFLRIQLRVLMKKTQWSMLMHVKRMPWFYLKMLRPLNIFLKLLKLQIL